jgi:hypothetical protein
VTALQARGVELVAAGDRVRFRPGEAVAPEDRAALRWHKAAVLALLRGPDPTEVARVLGLPVDQLDCVLEVRVAWLPVTLWFVPDAVAADALLGEGTSRGRIWTRTELLDLLAIPSLTKVHARTIATTKASFDGEVVPVRPAASTRVAPDGETAP